MDGNGGAPGVVGGEELKKLLGEIFHDGSGHQEQVHGSKYELRLARDYLWTGDDKYTPARKFEGSIVRLAPGDVILVASEEEFCMPWWLTANIGVKYGLVSQGLYALVGSYIDPGYGMTSNADGGERLYFMLANTSRETRELRPGQAVLSLQFHRHASMEQNKDALAAVHRTGTSLREALEDPDAPDPRDGLSFFPDMRVVERSVKDLWSRAELVVAIGMLVAVAALLGAIASVLFELLTRDNVEATLDAAAKFGDRPLAATVLVVWCVAWVLIWQEGFRHWARKRGPFPPRARTRTLRTRLRARCRRKRGRG
jgi:deoxycytidine triphosphate deaminase